MAPVDETLSLEDIALAHGSLRQLMNGFWGARALHAAMAVGIFDALVGGPMEATPLAGCLGLDGRGAEILLNALVALGLLEKDQSQFKNSAVSQVFLVRGATYYQGRLIAMSAGDWATWERLQESVRLGKPPGGARTRTFDNERVRAMNDSATVAAPMVARKLDLSRVKRVLDVGGGPATYAIALARTAPDIDVTVIETAEGSAVTREFVAGANMTERVRIVSGDFHQLDFGSGVYDLVLLSHILHLQSAETCRTLLGKAFHALTSEGQCVVHEFLLRDDKTGPLMPALFSLNMLLNTEHGRSYSGWEITEAMQNEGFIRVQIVPLDPTPSSLVIGIRP